MCVVLQKKVVPGVIALIVIVKLVVVVQGVRMHMRIGKKEKDRFFLASPPNDDKVS